MNQWLSILLLVVFSFYNFAESIDDTDSKEEKEVLSQTKEEKEVPPANKEESIPPVIIYENSSNVNPEATSNAPVISIPAEQPLSKADQLIESRKKLEKQTSDTLRERLEILRLRDEQKRLNQVLPPPGGQTEVRKAKPTESPSVGLNPSIIGSPYIGAGAGWIHYMDAIPRSAEGLRLVNLSDVIDPRSFLSLGLGGYFNEFLSMELFVNMSKHYLSFPDYTNDYQNRFVQYTAHALFKVHAILNKLRPFVGVAVAFSQRRYFPDPNMLDPYLIYQPLQPTTSYIDFDGGLTVGVDLFFTSKVAFGFNFCYYMISGNIKDEWYGTRRNIFINQYNLREDPETMNWMTANTHLKFFFN